jgi:predicted AlkP superfamily pyrophosphatase or phosphodiesterase
VKRRLALACLLLAAADPAASAAPARTVVLLLYDGLAPALLEAHPTPAFDRIAREGAISHQLEPVFPTISLINQVTISTGCWPEHHGIVTNVFLDSERGRYDHDGDADWLLGCEHLHQAAKRQGLRSAALWFVGAHSEENGDQAHHVSPDVPYDLRPPDAERMDAVLRLLALPPAERPHVISAYLNGPDSAEHFQGMDSQATADAVALSDALLGRLLAAIDAHPERDRIAVVVTTDHGMREVTTIVNIQRILGRHGIDATPVSTGTTSFLYFANDDPARVARAAEALAGYPEFEVLRRGAFPAYVRLGDSSRVPPLIVSAKPPYFIEDIDRWPGWLQWLGDWGPDFIYAGFSLKATHGYPPDTDGMHGVLYAWGSGVARGRELGLVRAIDVHPTLARLVGMQPGQPVDGVPITALLAE